MLHSLDVKTPPLPASKRQRSADARDAYPTADPAGNTRGVSSTQSPTSPIKMPAFLNKSRGEIHTAFEELDWNQRFRLQDAFTNPASPFKIDRTPAVVGRNRYANVQPWDSLRIKLKIPIGGSDYVNASPITLKPLGTSKSSENTSSSLVSSQASSQATTAWTEPSPEKNGNDNVTTSKMRYIATQGPKDGHFAQFWHMVMQETIGDVGVIVMLTKYYEGNKEKCSQYFPAVMNDATILLTFDAAGEDHKQPTHDNSESISEGGPVQTGMEASSDKVTLLSVTQDATTGCEVRKMALEIAGQTKAIYHYLFGNWPDYSKPEAKDRKALLELIKQSAQRTGRPDNPRFVHCSAGVGRTGTFIALDHLLRELEDGRLVTKKRDADAVARNGKELTWGRSGPVRESTPESKEDIIYNTVDKLREQRMMMVMSEMQFCFLYEVLKEAFMEKYSSKPGPSVTDEMPLKVARMDQPTVAEEARRNAKEEGEETNSDAETEVMDREDDKNEMDPYDAVAPENIMQGQKRTV